MVKRFVSIFLVGIVLCICNVCAMAENPSEVKEEGEYFCEVDENIVTGIVNANNIILRDGPTVETNKIATLEKGTRVSIIIGSEVENQDKYGARIRVRTENLEGYVAKKYVLTTETDGTEWYLLSYATTKAGANADRDVNVKIASEYINSKVLSPNEKFSFWDTVGKCTYEKGYKDATVYSNGKKTQGIGGGVCQVSTTVNIAAKSAGIVTNARQHSLPVSYAKREDEATVSYGNCDFKFTNTTEKTVKIVMKTGEGFCTCEIWAKVE